MKNTLSRGITQRKLSVDMIAITGLLLLMIASVGCGGSKGSKQEKKVVLTSFPAPKVPSMLTSPEAQAKYIADHYWDKFDFADTSLISRPDITEQGFADFVSVLPAMDGDLLSRAIVNMLTKAHGGDSLMFDHITELCDKYLYDPNSPFRSEDMHMIVLNYIISSPKIAEIEKIRPKRLLSIAMKNRPDSIANDFKYKLRNNSLSSMHKLRSDYTLLFFNNPECNDCARVKKYISSSPKITQLISDKELTVLSIYPDEDLNAWLKESYPSDWINGYDPAQAIEKGELYDLKAIPALYLLDGDKRVILKDAIIENIDSWLNKNANSQDKI